MIDCNAAGAVRPVIKRHMSIPVQRSIAPPSSTCPSSAEIPAGTLQATVGDSLQGLAGGMDLSIPMALAYPLTFVYCRVSHPEKKHARPSAFDVFNVRIQTASHYALQEREELIGLRNMS